MKHIVKRKDHTESYDNRKVYASVYAAAINAHYSEEDAEHLAEHVVQAVDAWIDSIDEVTSQDIRDKIIEAITDADVRLMYKHHLDLC